MRTVLRLLGTRYGAAVTLVVVIAVVVGAGKLIGGDRPAQAPLGTGTVLDSPSAGSSALLI